MYTYAYVYIYLHIYTYTHTHTHTLTHIYTHTYIYIYIHLDVYTYVYISIYICTYTYIYICFYSRKSLDSGRLYIFCNKRVLKLGPPKFRILLLQKRASRSAKSVSARTSPWYAALLRSQCCQSATIYRASERVRKLPREALPAIACGSRRSHSTLARRCITFCHYLQHF